MKLILLNREENRIGFLDRTDNFEPYREINGEHILELTIEDDIQIEKEYKLLYQDNSGTWFEYDIKEIEEEKVDGIVKKHLFCEHSFYETLGDYIADKRPSGSAKFALGVALNPTRWEVGIVDDLGESSTNFYRISAKEAVAKVVENWGGELRYRITVEGNKIVRREVDLLRRRGKDTGKRLEYNKDLSHISRTVQRDSIITAMYGFGKGEEIGDGFGRGIDFASVNDGKKYLENNEARKRWGRNSPEGKKVHRYGKVEDGGIEDPLELKKFTKQELDKRSQPAITYQLDAVDLYQETNYSEEFVLGDSIVVIDKDFIPELRVQARIVSITPRPSKSEGTSITLGNVQSTIIDSMENDNNRIDSVIDGIVSNINRVQKSANGKNRNFYGPEKPQDPAENDLWFKREDGEDGEVTLLQFIDGKWVEIIGSAVNKRIREAIKDAKDIAKIARARAIDVAEDLDEGTSFFKHSKDIGLASKDADGNINSIIDLQDDGTAYIGGEHIVLDGDTIVDGTFTVTDTIFSENMDISKFTVGTLNGKDVNIINLNVNNIVGNYGNFIKIGMKEANSNLELTGTKLEYTHTKTGNKTVMNADGLFYQDGGSNYRTNYLTHVQNVGKLNHFARNPRWVTLPKVFKGKQFKAFVIPSDTYGVTNDYKYYNLAMLRQVSYISKYDRKNGRVALAGYSYHRDIRNNNRYFKEISVTLVVTY